MMLNREIKPIFDKANAPYLHWQDLKNKDWLPANKTAFWYALKNIRRVRAVKLPIRDENHENFHVNLDLFSRQLHMFDKEMAGNLMGIPLLGEQDKRRFITRNLIDESIISSQLEGANTARAAARKMIIENRRPRTHSEKMIMNNHRTMTFIEEKLRHEPLTLEALFKLHTMITEDTLPADKQGKLRETFDEHGKPLVIEPWGDGKVAYVTPTRKFVERELPQLIEFANSHDGQPFIHPIVRAMLLHFWVGLLHPFEDGNGRLARVLFYWSALRQDYWAFAYISLSEFIYKSRGQYAMAYIYSEQDQNDLTYFVDYNIRQIEQARNKFIQYVDKQLSQHREQSSLLHKYPGLNERQLRLLSEMWRSGIEYTTIISYAGLSGTSRLTAIKDLAKLVTEGLLERQKRGRNSFYLPTAKVATLFK